MEKNRLKYTHFQVVRILQKHFKKQSGSISFKRLKDSALLFLTNLQEKAPIVFLK